MVTRRWLGNLLKPISSEVQGRKRQYDLLQRTAPLTGGRLEAGSSRANNIDLTGFNELV